MPGTSRRFALPRSGLVYGGSSLLANMLGYAFLAVLSRTLSPSEYGAAGALLGAGIISSILSVALQLVVARQVATIGSAGVSGRGALLLAGGTTAAALSLTPLAVHYLHLPDAWPAVWVAVTLMPMTLAGALLGQLLGRERFHRLALATVTMAGARLVSGLVAAAAGWGLSGALAALALATVLVVLGMCFLADVAEWWRRRGWLAVADLRDLAGAAGGVAAFLVLTNVDSVLARHHLPAATSGIYVLGSLFAKAGLWGPQFIAVVAFPRLAGPRRDRLLRRAALATAGFGLLIAAAAAVVAEPLVRIVSGDEYSAAARYAPAFALLGTLFALVNLGLLAHVARAATSFTKLLWLGAAVEAGVVTLWLHESVGQIVAACSAVAVVLAVLGLAGATRQQGVRDPSAVSLPG